VYCEDIHSGIPVYHEHMHGGRPVHREHIDVNTGLY
jgi:hypothetical protein